MAQRGRKPKLDWELYKDQLLVMKYEQKMSLTDINKALFDRVGVSVTNARLSQVFTKWKQIEQHVWGDGVTKDQQENAA